jgi:hypothetical protein
VPVLLAVLLALGVWWLTTVSRATTTRRPGAPTPLRLADAFTVSLLCALLAVQTFTSGHEVTFDPRTAVLAIAATFFWLRTPLFVVVMLAAGTASVLRDWGWV